MGSWNLSRRRQTLLIAAISTAALAAELSWKDPSPVLAPPRGGARAQSFQLPAPGSNKGLQAPAASANPRWTDLIAQEAASAGAMRDAVASVPGALVTKRWMTVPPRVPT